MLFVSIFIGTVQALLVILELCMFLRAILSWFPIGDDHPLVLFLCMVTEPIIAPIRALLDKLGWFRNLPIDISFIIAYLLLGMVTALLGILA